MASLSISAGQSRSRVVRTASGSIPSMAGFRRLAALFAAPGLERGHGAGEHGHAEHDAGDDVADPVHGERDPGVGHRHHQEPGEGPGAAVPRPAAWARQAGRARPRRESRAARARRGRPRPAPAPRGRQAWPGPRDHDLQDEAEQPAHDDRGGGPDGARRAPRTHSQTAAATTTRRQVNGPNTSVHTMSSRVTPGWASAYWWRSLATRASSGLSGSLARTRTA